MVSDFLNTRSGGRVWVKHLENQVFELLIWSTRIQWSYIIPSELGSPKLIRSLCVNVFVESLVLIRRNSLISPWIGAKIHDKQYTS